MTATMTAPATGAGDGCVCPSDGFRADNVLDAALAYAAAGLPVFPVFGVDDDRRCLCLSPGCERQGKHPMGALVPHGLKDATTDPKKVRAWFASRPFANVAIAMPPGLMVLDVDAGGMETLLGFEREHGPIPGTLRARTGSGGYHFFFAVPPDANLPNAVRFAPGLDTRTPGKGYVVASPSRHVSGARYSWENGLAPVPLPDWMLAILRKPSVQPTSTSTADGAEIPAGRRDNTLASLAGTMRERGMAPEAIEAALLADNAARCKPPLSDAEVSRIARSISRYQPRERVPGEDDGDPLEWQWVSDMGWQDRQPPEREYLFHYFTGPQQRWGLLPRHKVGLVVAAGGGSKSTATMGMGIAVATGTALWETYRTDRPGNVVLLAAEEDRDDAHRRWINCAAAAGLTAEQRNEAARRMIVIPLQGRDVMLRAAEDKGGRETKFFERLRERLDTSGVDWDLVILDPLSRFESPDCEVDNSAATRFVALLEQLTQVRGRPNVIVTHHSTKSSRNGYSEATAARGSSGITDAARWVMNLDPVSEGTGENKRTLHDRVIAHVTKSNYTRFPDELLLIRDPRFDGALRPATTALPSRCAANCNAIDPRLMELLT